MAELEPNMGWQVAETILFEQWLRFYFIVEENDDLVLRLDQAEEEQVLENWPRLSALVEALNGHAPDHHNSLAAICLSLGERENGEALLENAAAIVADQDFQEELNRFSAWLFEEANELDRQRLPFDDWLERFARWRGSVDLREYCLRFLGFGNLEQPVCNKLQ